MKHLKGFIPDQCNKYYEPFLGGGAMFFYLGPANAEISDVSEPLIETYRAARIGHAQILQFLRRLRPDRTTFDILKRYSPRTEINKAAQFIFLNKACWNGLYRVNSDGIFNVPYGQPRTDFLIDEKNFARCSTQLRRRGVSIRCQDFQEIEPRVAPGDFVFLDPPYVTSHNKNGFVDWNESLFRWSDQERLAGMARRLAQSGANVLVTNAAHADVRALYAGFGHREFSRHSSLASDVSRRTATSEAIFYGGPAYDCVARRAFGAKGVVHGLNGDSRAS